MTSICEKYLCRITEAAIGDILQKGVLNTFICWYAQTKILFLLNLVTLSNFFTNIIELRYILAKTSAPLPFYNPYTSKQNYKKEYKKDSFFNALVTKLYTLHKNMYKRTSSSFPCSKHNSFTLVLINLLLHHVFYQVHLLIFDIF